MTKVEACDVGKHPNLIKKAQSEMTEVDVLVCGKCHAVYHHVENFREHKSKTCKVDSTLRDCRETKPKVWAFLLWKASQISQMESNTINSWNLYKRWIDLDEDVRETWIVAGETIQSFAKTGQAQLQELPVKVTKHVLPDDEVDEDTPKTRKLETQRMPQQVQRPVQKTVSRTIPTTTTRVASPMSPVRNVLQRPGITIRKTEVPVTSPVKTPTVVSKIQPGQIFHAKHYDNETGTLKEHRVEKILAKRFNPRKKLHEYLVKWNNEEQLEANTWEPQTHLDTCMPLLEVFETQLAKQKEARAKLQQAAFDQLKGSPAAQSTPRPTISRPPLRPTQSNVNESTLKRKGLDSDYDTTTEDESSIDSPGIKRIRTESGRVIIRRTVNGATPKSPSAAEVVLTSPKDNKQSGVVKKPGVSVTSPRTESAQVRMLRKGETAESGVVRIVGQKPGGATQIVRQSTASPIVRSGTTVQKVVQKTSPQVNVTKKTVPVPTRAPTTVGRTTVTRITRTEGPKVIEHKVVSRGGQKVTTRVTRKPSSDDEDDGLPDLFPTEIKVPAPNSPERPLTLCPLTGKVLGRAEGEKTPPPEEPPKEEPEEKVEAGTSKQENQEGETELTTADTTIQQVMTNEDGTPLLVTGEDGTIYQVAGKNAEGQTILIAQGADGEQQCMFLAADESLNLLGAEVAEGQTVVEAQEGAPVTQQLTIQTEGEEGQITAEVVQAELPSPGGTRRVVLLLPDGTFMMTEVNDEQYQSLNLVQ
uniref:CSON006104 protein n=1 Tax=Culicoides sonorensis TaxID=179676 RepID=A0A336M7T0_CULSO